MAGKTLRRQRERKAREEQLRAESKKRRKAMAAVRKSNLPAEEEQPAGNAGDAPVAEAAPGEHKIDVWKHTGAALHRAKRARNGETENGVELKDDVAEAEARAKRVALEKKHFRHRLNGH
eukprot:TRINITY_DN52175_c0_g1_i1.p2 TRINITY_DN52175_c0_g1~~TRINITY_DN52175_c0_g1_i1.p2  ORF type:complete len:120 (-),score=37.20 TRINITY_DN52175_c0_g1_i1:309-668(-)